MSGPTERCLVTGATGFLGTNLVQELVGAGWEVRATGMHGSETRYLESLPVEVRLADITAADEVDPLVAGCDVVFHVAGDTSFWRRRFDLQRRINVEGTLNVARAAIRHGVRRMVHTSTLDVLGHDPSRRPITEAIGGFNFDRMGYNYGETKHEAETRLRQLAGESGLDLVVVYPGFMCGPFDHTLQLGQVFFSLRDRRLPGSPPGGSSFCHVTEVARAHVAAAARGRAGEGYLCAGHNLSYHEWFGQMAAAIGARPSPRVLPRWAVVAYGYLAEWWSLISRKHPDLNPGQARYMSEWQFCDSTKAQGELGYVIPPIEQITGDAVRWYREHGYDL